MSSSPSIEVGDLVVYVGDFDHVQIYNSMRTTPAVVTKVGCPEWGVGDDTVVSRIPDGRHAYNVPDTIRKITDPIEITLYHLAYPTIDKPSE